MAKIKQLIQGLEFVKRGQCGGCVQEAICSSHCNFNIQHMTTAKNLNWNKQNSEKRKFPSTMQFVYHNKSRS